MFRIVNTKKMYVQTNEERRLERELADQQLVNARIEVVESQKLIARLEKEIVKIEQKYEDALEARDRAVDNLLVSSTGLPEVSSTAKRDKKRVDEKNEELANKHDAEMYEMFGESLDQMEEIDGLALPGELRAEADKLISAKTK